MSHRRRTIAWALGVLLLYGVVSGVYTHPLLARAGSALASDPGDPALNAGILLWNASVVPFTAAWWNAPQYYPTPDVVAFTETLVGLSPLATPVIWASGNLILGHNITYFLSWPLSAWSVYLLVLYLSRRQDASILAGLAFAFSPYRLGQLAHLQTLSTEWLPLLLLGLHGYRASGRARWLVLFGIAWILTSLSNGYYMLFGAVLIALWLLYFGSAPGGRRPSAIVLAAWALASVPLVPVLLKYRAVHAHFGLSRTYAEVLAFSAKPADWAHVASDAWLWRDVMTDGNANLFPGVIAVLVILAGIIAVLWRRRSPARAASRWIRYARPILAVVALLGAVATIVTLCVGPWSISVGGVLLFRLSTLGRALVVTAACGGALVWMTPSTRDALRRRSALAFYAMATLVIGIFCLGPILRVGDAVLLTPMPYQWLLAVPGFSELRVLTRFWMLAILCLAAAGGLAYPHLQPTQTRRSWGICAMLAACLLVDGWTPSLRMADPIDLRSGVERTGTGVPMLELPIGPDWDYPATYRAFANRRRVANGVSGYDPPYYNALVAGLQRRDSPTLAAIASWAPIEVVVDREADHDGAILLFVSSYTGAVLVRDDGRRIVYRIPQAPPEPQLGASWPIASVRAVRNERDAPSMHDGRVETGWGDYPQKADGWVLIDLGAVREIGGLTHAIGDFYLDFPRHLVIEASLDGSSWDVVWEGATTGPLVLASVRAPRVADMRLAFETHRARFVRLRQTENYRTMWRISELSVHAPAAK